ncbi:MAG: hypothetical protein KIH69_011225 [Anaerolineae bacterium]|nr:hypothetical protein [Anaerolineae bacterium]
MRLKHLLRPAILLTIAIILSKPASAAWHANQAQLQALHGTPRSDLWQKAIALTANPHWQQQWVLSQWQAGQVPRADDLLPHLSPTTQNTFADAFVFADLLAQQRDQEIVQRYRQAAQPTTPNACAAIVLAHLKTATILSNAQISNLLGCAFSKNSTSAEFNLLPQAEFEKPAFWASDLGQRIITALTWQAQLLRPPTPQSPESAPVVSPPQITALLNGSPEQKLGPNLIKNGNFETLGCALPHITPSCAIAHWQPSLMNTGSPWNVAVFVLGKENVTHTLSAPSDAMRIDGLSIERLATREPARAGFSYFTPITLEPNRAYALSFVYRVNSTIPHHAASFWLTGEANVIHQHEFFLPATPNGWNRVTLIGWNRSGKPATIQPLLRLWHEGTVWFDDFAIYPILSDPPLPPSDTIIEIHSLN